MAGRLIPRHRPRRLPAVRIRAMAIRRRPRLRLAARIPAVDRRPQPRRRSDRVVIIRRHLLRRLRLRRRHLRHLRTRLRPPGSRFSMGVQETAKGWLGLEWESDHTGETVIAVPGTLF
jgi:hypothetical protein